MIKPAVAKSLANTGSNGGVKSLQVQERDVVASTKAGTEIVPGKVIVTTLELGLPSALALTMVVQVGIVQNLR